VKDNFIREKLRLSIDVLTLSQNMPCAKRRYGIRYVNNLIQCEDMDKNNNIYI
jgi:hypothetical protein